MGVKVELCTATTGVLRTDEYPKSNDWFFDSDGSFKIYAPEDPKASEDYPSSGYAAEYPKDNVLRVYAYDADPEKQGDTEEPEVYRV